MDPRARPCKHPTELMMSKINPPQNELKKKKRRNGRTEIALGVDEEVVGTEPDHVGAAHVRIVPLQLLVPLLLLLR